MKFQKEQTRFKRVFKYYRYIESDAFAQYLHEMSLKGWHLKEWMLRSMRNTAGQQAGNLWMAGGDSAFSARFQKVRFLL